MIDKNYDSEVFKLGSLSQAPQRINREIFDSDVRRVIRVGWLVIAFSTIVNLILLPSQADSWKIIAVTIIFCVSLMALILEYLTKSPLAFSVVPITLLIMPIVFSNQSQESWIAYGLVIIPAIIHATAINDYRISLAVIYFLILLQYVVSKLNFASISDNVDNQLLSSYFATSWSVIVGMGALLIKRAYLRYYDAIEAAVDKVHELQISEYRNISNLNLHDHLNGKLHGTILNTLIAIRNSPQLLSNKDVVRRYISEDLESLEMKKPNKPWSLKEYLGEVTEASLYRELDITYQSSVELELDPVFNDVVREIIRELILNIKKHSKATECSVTMEIQKRSINEGIETSIHFNELILKVTDNSPRLNNLASDSQTSNFRSESISRLLKSINGQITQSSDSQSLTQEITLSIPESHRTYLEHIKTLRMESINYLSKGFIILTLLFAIVTFPAYLVLGVDYLVALLFLLQIALLSISLRIKRIALPLAAIGSIIAISIFPVISLREVVCQEIQYLPWLFNGILGSAFFVTLLVKSNVLKWVPISLFFGSSLIIQEKLPKACENLLDGSIPAIVLIAFIAIGFMRARNKSERLQMSFFAESKKAYKGIEVTRSNVEQERAKIIQELMLFSSWLENSKKVSPDEMQNRINRLILCLRTFLLTSEYFDSVLITSLYRYSLSRNLSGVETRLEISASDFNLKITKEELGRIFDVLEDATREIPVEIQVTRDDFDQVSIVVKASSKVEPLVIKKDQLKIQLLQKP